MRRIFDGLRWLVLPLIVGLLVLAPAFADDAADKAALDALFIELHAAPDAETAQAIDQRIWAIWTAPSISSMPWSSTIPIMPKRGTSVPPSII